MLHFTKSLKWILAVPLLFLAAYYLVSSRVSDSPVLFPSLGHIPQFSFKNQDKNTFSEKDLLGKVSIVNFIFSSCPTVCPLLTQKMQVLTQKISDPTVQFISISVDPVNDTPEVLKKYREEFGVNDSRWTFLTGPLDQITDVVVKGFKMVLIREKNPEKAETISDLFDITHGEHFVLVDKEGQIRLYQMLQSPEDEKNLLKAVQILTK